MSSYFRGMIFELISQFSINFQGLWLEEENIIMPTKAVKKTPEDFVFRIQVIVILVFFWVKLEYKVATLKFVL